MADEITLKQGEAKTVTLTYTDSDDAAINVANDTFVAAARVNVKGGDDLFTVADGSFDKTNGATGIVTFPISSTNSNQDVGAYVLEIKKTASATDIDKSNDITMNIQEATT